MTVKNHVMKLFSFPMWADILFYSACTFLLSLSLMRYFAVPLPLAATVSSLLALAAGGISFLLLYRKRQKTYLGKREEERREALLLHLALEKQEKVRLSLLAAFSADKKIARCEGETLFVDEIPVVPLFTMEPIGADAVARLLREYGKQFLLVCNTLTDGAEKLVSSFSVKVMKKEEIYDLFTRTGTTPDPLICGEIPRNGAKQKLRRAFSKSNARPFFVSGAVLLVMSLFTLFPLYYCIAGGVLLVCSVAVRLFGCSA